MKKMFGGATVTATNENNWCRWNVKNVDESSNKGFWSCLQFSSWSLVLKCWREKTEGTNDEQNGFVEEMWNHDYVKGSMLMWKLKCS